MALTILMVLSVIILSLTGLALVENPIYMEKAGVEEAGLPPEAFTAITIGSMLFGGVIGTPVLLLLRSLFHWLFMMLFREKPHLNSSFH